MAFVPAGGVGYRCRRAASHGACRRAQGQGGGQRAVLQRCKGPATGEGRSLIGVPRLACWCSPLGGGRARGRGGGRRLAAGGRRRAAGRGRQRPSGARGCCVTNLLRVKCRLMGCWPSRHEPEHLPLPSMGPPCRLLRPTPSALSAFEGSALGLSESAAEAGGTAAPARTRSSRSSGASRRRCGRVMASTDNCEQNGGPDADQWRSPGRPRATPTMIAQCKNCTFLVA